MVLLDNTIGGDIFACDIGWDEIEIVCGHCLAGVDFCIDGLFNCFNQSVVDVLAVNLVCIVAVIIFIVAIAAHGYCDRFIRFAMTATIPIITTITAAAAAATTVTVKANVLRIKFSAFFNNCEFLSGGGVSI